MPNKQSTVHFSVCHTGVRISVKNQKLLDLQCEIVTLLALLNRHIYNFLTQISKLHVHTFYYDLYISCVYNPVLHDLIV